MATTDPRPTENNEWAESAAFGDVSEPAAKRPGGYLYEDTFPHDEFNWLQRMVTRWIQYLDSKLYNEYGELAVTNDDASLYQVAMETGSAGFAAVREFVADRIIADEIDSRGGSGIDFLDSINGTLSGVIGSFSSYLQAGQYRPQAGDEIDFRDASGTNATVKLLAYAIKAAFGTHIEALASGSGPASIGSINTPKAYARINASGTSPSFDGTPYGVSSVADGGTQPAGDYVVTLSNAASVKEDMVFALAAGPSPQEDLDVSVHAISTTEIQIRCEDSANTPTDWPGYIYLTVFYP